MVGICIVVWLEICRRLGLAILVSLCWIMREVGWGVLLVLRSPLHGVVDFHWLQLWWRLLGVLVQFRFGVNVDGAIFGFVVGFVAMVHVVEGSWCIWASTAPTASVPSSASLAALWRPLVKRSRNCLLWRSSIIFCSSSQMTFRHRS
jgi:hypothetical protein